MLFVKYIFYDKTEPFSSSLPPTPAISRTNSSKNLHGGVSTKEILPPTSPPGKLELDPAVHEQMRQLQSERLKLLLEGAGTVPSTARCPFSYLIPRTSEEDSIETMNALESATEPAVGCDLPQKVTQETQTDVVVAGALPSHHLFTVNVDDDSTPEGTSPLTPPAESNVLPTKPRPLEECKAIFKSEVCNCCP